MESQNKIKSPTNLYYKSSSIETQIPLTEELLNKLFSPENIQIAVNSKTINRLSPYLPSKPQNLIESPENLCTLLTRTTTKFTTPMKVFYSMYTSGFFTENYQKNRPIFEEACLSQYIDEYKLTLTKLEKYLTNSPYGNGIDNIITFDLHSELASSGYSSEESNKDTFSNINDPISKEGFSPRNEKSEIIPPPSKRKAGGDCSQSNSGDEYSIVDNNILTNERFKNLKKNKNQVTIKPRTPEEIKDFQKQEVERYKHPRLPWEYTLLDGTKCIVAPLFKKSKGNVTTKARDHILLKQDRPSFITILALVRDAASKLQDGVGTRADICDLLKDSQYINENLLDSQINGIVSGALDRLHYEKDPCVRYDLHRKLWIYLHRNRTVDFPAWRDNDAEDLRDIEKGSNTIIINNSEFGLREDEAEYRDNENVQISNNSIIIKKSHIMHNGEIKDFYSKSAKKVSHHSLGKKHSFGDFHSAKSKKRHKIK